MTAVKLRPLEMSDLDKIMTWVNDRDVIKNFANFNHPISRDAERKYIGELLQSQNDKIFSVENEEGLYLGQVGLNQIHWPSRVGRLSIIIGNKDQWGRGYAQASLRELLKLAFENYNLHKVWLITYKTNERMQHIMKKLGFKEEGILREEYYANGSYHDVVRMSLLQKEYFANNGGENDA